MVFPWQLVTVTRSIRRQRITAGVPRAVCHRECSLGACVRVFGKTVDQRLLRAMLLRVRPWFGVLVALVVQPQAVAHLAKQARLPDAAAVVPDSSPGVGNAPAEQQCTSSTRGCRKVVAAAAGKSRCTQQHSIGRQAVKQVPRLTKTWLSFVARATVHDSIPTYRRTPQDSHERLQQCHLLLDGRFTPGRRREDGFQVGRERQ